MSEVVKLRGVSTYHPAQAYDNQFFVEHFNAMGLESEGLMNHLGRKTRYLVSTEDENSLTMAIEVSKRLLQQENTSAAELDMIVFVSDTPEYTYPSNALMVHQALGAVNANMVYDLNTNCIGMLTAIDQVSAALLAKKHMRRALVVASVHVSNIARSDDTIVYPNFSDGAAAVILEKTEGTGGYIDAHYKTDSKLHQTVMFPATGFSKLFRNDIQLEEKRLRFEPHDVSYFSDEWKKLILELLERNGLSVPNIDHWIFSQFSRPEILETLEKLEAGYDSYTFVGEQYGYTGVTSPIFALQAAMQQGKVVPGSTVLFCSVGIGYTMSAVLYQF
ncbi:3-oxoacyl-[acyl-carrier-protein] synthase III C-terminal domain-containing protein [Paenibacillus turpanensis]|uniref:3-oxoacyl-[acyl-carrier-protein] synthase III C-terminal domain-containing protein n=1 Tax=Paenibacillus turpanensis TaxID=2689078 RepID=UPI001409CB43|nr:3-oxoacyl-[acyl-carrier-protein] synthase III C-terminal domain-containing protein [Paenibacillus turpanensis]